MKKSAMGIIVVLLLGGVVKAQDVKNVRVLPFKSTREIVPYMKEMAGTLGVKCNFCHNMKDKSLDEIKHKLIAREMMRMVNGINKDYMTPLKVDAITCWTCHRGTSEPPRNVDDKRKPHKH